MDKNFLVIGILGMLLGLLFVGITVGLFLRKFFRTKNWAKTTGVVVNVEISEGMRQSYSTPRNTLFKPTVRFQAADGRIVDYTPQTSNSWSNYQVGENVAIHYDPRQPQNAFIGGGLTPWFGFLVFGLVGGVFVLVGAFFTFVISGNLH